MRELIALWLDGRLSRRGFFRRMAAAGFATSAIRAILSDAEAAEATATGPIVPGRSATGTGGELFVEQLRASGCEYLFLNPGSAEVGLFDALVDVPDVQTIVGLHEGIVISMAHGYTQVTGRAAFVNVHAISGTAQMAGQLYNAHRDNAPIVVTAGLLDPTILSDDVVIAPRPGHEQTEVNRQFTRLSWEVRNATSIPLALRRAVKLATTPPGGPVYVAFASYALSAPKVTAEILPQEQFRVSMRVRPEQAQTEQIARWLIEARQPFLFVGPALRQSGAMAHVVKLADMLGMPVMEEPNFVSTNSGFPTDHPFYYDTKAWVLGGMSFAPFDMFLGLGNENLFPTGEIVQTGPDPQMATAPPRLPRSAKKASIGWDASRLGRTEPLDLAIVADPGLAARDLLEAVASLATQERLARIRVKRAEKVLGDIAAFRKRMQEAVDGNRGRQPMHPDEVGTVIEDRLDADAITVHENLSHDFFCSYSALLRYGEGAKQRVANSGATLGWGIGAAIGAKIGSPDRQVVLHIGDGSVMYSASGFWTMARYGVPVLTLVWNNHDYQTVRQAYAGYKGKMRQADRYPAVYLGDPEIDFVKLAGSQGVKGERATTLSELTAALTRGIAATRAGEPYLIDILVARLGPGSTSTWHQAFNLASRRRRKV